MKSQRSQRRVGRNDPVTSETEAAQAWPTARHPGNTGINHLVIGLRSRRVDHAGIISWILLKISAQDCRTLEVALAEPGPQVALRPYRAHAPGAPQSIRWTLKHLRHDLVAVVGVSRRGRELHRSMPIPVDRLQAMVRADGGPTGPFELLHGQVMFFDAQPRDLRDSFDRHLTDRLQAPMHRRRAPAPPRRARQRIVVAGATRPAGARRMNATLHTGLRRSALSATVCAVLVTAVPARYAFSATYTTSITGNAAADGAYSTFTSTGGKLVYQMQRGDSISVSTNQLPNVQGVALNGVSTPVVLQAGTAGTGALGISAGRTVVTDPGVATGVDLAGGSNLAINGNATINASTDTTNSTAFGIHVDRSTATFNGNTTITTNSPGYSQGVRVFQGRATFNGDTSIIVRSRGSNTDGVHNFGGGTSNVTFNGKLSIDTVGVHPSDNVHGIYNDNGGTRLTVNGALDLSAVSNGSTVFGIRNQGTLAVTGDAKFVVTGPRSALGIANTYRTAQANFGGNVDVKVTNFGAYTPFGRPTALQNVYATGSGMTFAQSVNASVTAATTAFGIDSNGVMKFNSATAPTTINVASNCSTCNNFGIRQNGGTLTIAAGARVAASVTGTGTSFVIANSAANGVDSSVDINGAGNGRVMLDGQLSTANYASSSNTGTTNVVFNTADSYLRGNLLPFANTGLVADATKYTAGATNLTFTNGATWIPTGSTGSTSDFGAGGLTLGSGGGIDMSRNWGTFEPGKVPVYSLRTLTVDSSAAAGARVDLKDGATFSLVTDVRHGDSDKVVFGSGVKTFSAAGAQNVRIAYDPVLEDTSWVNANTVKNGKTFTASAPITVVDASAAAGGTAKFSAVSGTTSSWSHTYENALVSFAYTPQVAVSPDGSKVLLNGIRIEGSAAPAPGPGPGPAPTPASGTGTGTGMGMGTESGSSGPTGIRPAEAILTASESLEAMRGLLQRATARADRLVKADDSGSSVWLTPLAGHEKSGTSYSREYRQNIAGLQLGVDRRVHEGDGSSVRVGVALTQAHGDVDYANGSGSINLTSLALTARYSAANGAYFRGQVSGANALDRYVAVDSQGSSGSGQFHVKSVGAGLQGGFPVKVGHGLTLEPSTAAAAAIVFGDHDVTSAGVAMDLSRKILAQVDLGVTLRHTGANDVFSHQFHGRVARVQVVGDALTVNASKDGGSISAVAAPGRRGGNEVALGGSLDFGSSKNLSLTFETARQYLSGSDSATGSTSTSAWSGQVGIGYRW